MQPLDQPDEFEIFRLHGTLASILRISLGHKTKGFSAKTNRKPVKLYLMDRAGKQLFLFIIFLRAGKCHSAQRPLPSLARHPGQATAGSASRDLWMGQAPSGAMDPGSRSLTLAWPG
ncbi:MAG: hypothetical protein Kow00114_27620 [Kiloniellaceae bacterium]